MDKLAAVLTGDLIGSTEAEPSQVERSMDVLAEAAAFIAKETRNHSTRFTRYRGDGWQIHLEYPGDALWAAVYLNAALKTDPQCLATRIAIGLGAVAKLGAFGLGAAGGAAFTYSGHALDLMRASQTLTLAGETTDAIQRSLIDFMADRMSGWSLEQAEVVELMIRYGEPSQKAVADRLKITRQAVGARLQAAGYALIWRATGAFRDRHETEEVA